MKKYDFARKNAGYIVHEETGEVICRRCGRPATPRKLRKRTQYRCDKCAYKRRRELHPPEHPRVLHAPKPKPKRVTPAGRTPQPSPMQHWPDEWKVCHASFLAGIYAKSGSNESLIHYRQVLHDFFVSVNGKLPSLVSRAEVEAFLSSPGQQRGNEGKAIKCGTWNFRLCALRSFMKYCAEWPALDANGVTRPLLDRLSPCAGIRFQQREKPAYRSLSDDDLTTFFGAIDKTTAIGARDYALFLSYFWLARRKLEVAHLKWGDIQPAVIVDGNVRRTGYLYSWRGKGKSRVVDSQEMPTIVYDSIVHSLEVSGRRDTIEPDDYIFTVLPGAGNHGYDPKRPLSPNTIWQRCVCIAAAAGIDQAKICVHAFRHSAAAARYVAGQDIYSIKTLLRHSSLDMTAIYLSELAGSADIFQSQMSARYGNL